MIHDKMQILFVKFLHADSVSLNSLGLVMTYGDSDLGEHWLR